MTQGAPSKPFDNSDASFVDTKIESESFETSDDRFERVHSLWFEDGNVVIAAQEFGFRVHKGILSRHSAVFVKVLEHLNDSDALADELGLVIDAGHKVEGSVVVHVSDSAHDFVHLFRIFYDGFDYLKSTRPDDFADLAAAARLAHKYTVPVVLAEATLRLQQLFPPTFDIWDATEDVRAAAERVRPHDAIEAVNLFHTLGSGADGAQAGNVLPATLYLCCQLAPGQLLRGHRRADGTLERLTMDDVECCWKLQQTLTEKTTAMAEQLCLDALWVAYAEKKRCKCFRGSDKGVPWRWLTEVRGSDPLGRMVRDQLRWAERKFNVCEKCMSTLQECERMIRAAYWVELQHDYGRGHD
ncbi:hypothetical protein V8D89_001804 [Ganoderma adspersum]